MPADEGLGGLVHRPGVERRLHPPGAAAVERERRAAVDDAVKIMAGAGAAPGVETGIGGLGLENRDRMGMKQRVQPLAETEWIPCALKVDMRDLAQRMHAGVGAPGAMGGRALARHGEKRVLQRLLDRKAILLALPADERRAVIFEGELETRHRRSIRAGSPRWKALVQPFGSVLASRREFGEGCTAPRFRKG